MQQSPLGRLLPTPCVPRLMGPLSLRLVEGQATALTTERLSRDLKGLQERIKGIKYSTMMKILRLALSGQQVKAIWGWDLPIPKQPLPLGPEDAAIGVLNLMT